MGIQMNMLFSSRRRRVLLMRVGMVMDGVNLLQKVAGNHPDAQAWAAIGHGARDKCLHIGTGKRQEIHHKNVFGAEKTAIALGQTVIAGEFVRRMRRCAAVRMRMRAARRVVMPMRLNV